MRNWPKSAFGNKRFLCRSNPSPEGEWQVYGVGLEHVCFCDQEEIADMICDALNEMFDKKESSSAE